MSPTIGCGANRPVIGHSASQCAYVVARGCNSTKCLRVRAAALLELLFRSKQFAPLFGDLSLDRCDPRRRSLWRRELSQHFFQVIDLAGQRFDLVTGAPARIRHLETKCEEAARHLLDDL